MYHISDLTDTQVDRLLSRFRKQDGHWPWLSIEGRDGRYEIFTARVAPYEQAVFPAHRVVYEFYEGEVPEHLVMDHLCRTTWCVNPEHLEPVPQRINLLRGLTVNRDNALKTLCPYGHIFDKIDSRGFRVCSVCAKDRDRKYRLKIRREVTV